MKTRRGRGEGSIYRRPNGVWCGILNIGVAWDASTQRVKRRRRYFYGKTKEEILEHFHRVLADQRNGLPIDPPKERVAAYLRRWLSDVARPAVRPSTHRLYEGIIRIHVEPRIGGLHLVRLNPADIQGLLSDMEREGASPRKRQMVYAVLHRALMIGLRWGLVPRNVADAVTPPRVSRKEMRVWTVEQMNQFLRAAREDRLYAAYVLSLATGLRQGEALGLTWEDVDFKDGTLQVRRQLSDNNGHPILMEPKTAKARRRIELPAVAVAALKEHRERMFAEGRLHGEGNPRSLIFCDTTGKLLRPSNVVRSSFLKLVTRAGVPRIRWHDMRHTAATVRLLQGDHPRVVQELLGHSQISLTLDTYSHVMPGLQKASAEKVDAIFQAHR